LPQSRPKAGTAPERLVTNVVARYLDDEARFRAAVEKGIAAAERWEFVEEEEMDARPALRAICPTHRRDDLSAYGRSENIQRAMSAFLRRTGISRMSVAGKQ